jgi:2-polyprenyl-6-methoxyphenol hydroxylase-like FAD-dependent oxidoreductase
MVIKNKKVAIVGGGPGGLTLASLLQKKGANVTVYERDLNKNVRVQGATLDLHEESGLKALEAAGLMEAFHANFRPGADKLRIVNKHAAILFDDDKTKTAKGWNRPEIDRGPLRKILLDSLQVNTVVWDSHFSALTADGNGWKIEFKNGTFALADIVIAADGANSKIRPFITTLKPFFSGITMVEGAVYKAAQTVPAMHKLLNGGKIFALSDDKSLVVSSKGDGSLVFYTGCKTDENWVRDSGIDFSNKAQVIAWFKKEFAGWDNCWLELFEKAESSFILRPQYCMPLDQHWKAQPNLTMIGDAAHVMPPYAGEGVNMAMLDAYVLSNCLTKEGLTSIQSGIAAYEKEMCGRFKKMGALTLEQTASLHSVNGLENLLAMFKGEH